MRVSSPKLPSCWVLPFVVVWMNVALADWTAATIAAAPLPVLGSHGEPPGAVVATSRPEFRVVSKCSS